MKVNLYDFDGTIYDGDSSIDFYLFCLKKKLFIIKFLPKFIVFVVFYKLGLKTKEQMKECFFCFLTCFDNVDSLVDLFWDKNIKKIKKFYTELNHEHDIIISASPYFLLLPICEKLKVKALIASEVDKNTGRYSGNNCRGEEKVYLFKKKYNDVIVESAYSDSKSDMPMLNLAKNKFIVKKDKIIRID